MASGCNPCEGNPNSFQPLQKISNTNCSQCDTDATCITYTGPNLVCIGKNAGSNLEQILLSIDAKVCSATSDWSGFNYHCLSDEYIITNPEQFVSAITSEYCNLQSAYNTFTTTTYPTGINNLQTQINQIVSPNLTFCAGTGILTTDTYPTIITKLASNICSLQTSQNVSTANWNQCFTTSPLPTTIVQGFNVVLNQICTLQSQINNQVVLPTFNNQGSCLSIQGTADTLVNTVNSIKTRVCQTPIFDIDSAPWNCIANPATGSGANLQAAFNAVLNRVNTLAQKETTFDPNYFITSYNVSGQPCSGTFVTLDASAINGTDRFVASNATDATPGTLADKLSPGTNITLDFSTNPGQVILNSTATDQLVKTTSGDPSAGYLLDKVNGVTNVTAGVSITTTNNVSTNKVDFIPNVDPTRHINWLFDQIENDLTLYNRFCELMCGCGPCAGSTTSTTTTKPTGATLRVYFENQSTTTPVNINVILNQNSPTVGFINNGFNILANGATATGYYNLTSPISPRTVNLTLTNPDYGVKNYTVDVAVYQGSSGPLVPGSSSTTQPTLNTYNEPNFSIGSLAGDIVIKITIRNVVMP